MQKITIHTDGSCLGNPGNGGCAAILSFGEYTKEISKGYFNTTNNRMELMAAIIAFEALKTKRHKIVLVSDSQYLLNALQPGKLQSWRMIGYKKIKNPDLLERLENAIEDLEIETTWTRGHSGNALNERCDKLAKNAALYPTESDGKLPF